MSGAAVDRGAVGVEVGGELVFAAFWGDDSLWYWSPVWIGLLEEAFCSFVVAWLAMSDRSRPPEGWRFLTRDESQRLFSVDCSGGRLLLSDELAELPAILAELAERRDVLVAVAERERSGLPH